VNGQFVVSSKTGDLRRHIQGLGAKRRRDRLGTQEKGTLERSIRLPAKISTTDALSKTISSLQEVLEEAAEYKGIMLDVTVE